MTRAIAAALALLTASTGCSWVFSESVPAGHPPQLMPTCTAHRGTVAVDSAYAVGLGLAALVLASIEDDEGVSDRVALLFGVPAGLFATSAFIGVGRTTDCREARAAHERWLFDHRDGGTPPPRSYPGPPGAPR